MIEAFFAVDPFSLAINTAKECKCKQLGPYKSQPFSYTRTKHKKAAKTVETLAKLAWAKFGTPVYPDGPVILEIESRPKTVHRKGPAVGLPCMDDDAPVKAVRDALEGSAYANDSQVRLHIPSKTLIGPVGIRVRVYRAELLEERLAAIASRLCEPVEEGEKR